MGQYARLKTGEYVPMLRLDRPVLLADRGDGPPHQAEASTVDIWEANSLNFHLGDLIARCSIGAAPERSSVSNPWRTITIGV
jgi:hypothetical protein